MKTKKKTAKPKRIPKSIKFTSKEIEFVEERAKLKGLKFGTYVRQCVLG